MREDSQRNAENLIARAAILLEETNQGCMTPGATYHIDFWNDRIQIAVSLTLEQSEKLAKLPEYKRQFAEDILHNYFQVAVWKILEDKML